MLDLVTRTISESWLVLGQMAPYLLLGFVVAGVLSVCIPPAWVERHLGGRGLAPVFTASMIGVPLPLCSCGVIPVSASIRRHGASRAATTAFLLSTPQTGVDSIAVTYALLGPVFAVFRPVVALLTGLVGGFLVQLLDEPDEASKTGALPEEETCEDACCKDGGKGEKDACCEGEGGNGGGRGMLVRAGYYGLVTLPRDIGLALFVGVLLAGLLATLVPQDQLSRYVGGGIGAILLLMALGVPVYVCATASVPIAAGFMHVGASPGAALAFLIAGPATNAATLATIWKVLGRRTTVVYGATVAVSAVAFGLLLDWIVPRVGVPLPQLAGHAHATAGASWLTQLSAVTLLAVVAFSFLVTTRRAKGSTAHEEQTSGAPSGQQRLELAIVGMRCSHCAESVKRSLLECKGVREATVDLRHARAVVMGCELGTEELVSAVTALGYAAEEVPPHLGG